MQSRRMESDVWIIEMPARLLKINKWCTYIHFNILVFDMNLPFFFFCPFFGRSCFLANSSYTGLGLFDWSLWCQIVVGGGCSDYTIYHHWGNYEYALCLFSICQDKYCRHEWWWISFLTFVLLGRRFDGTGQLRSYRQWLLNQNHLILGHNC